MLSPDPMKLSVKCKCAVKREIDTAAVGSCRLRCRTCGDVLYDPLARGAEAKPEPEPEPEDETAFQEWLEASRELKLILSSENEKSLPCPTHVDQRVVAACNHCARLLCKRCLDRVDDSFTCSACLDKAVAPPKRGWLGRMFGGA